MGNGRDVLAGGEPQVELRKRDRMKATARRYVRVPLAVRTSDLPKRAASAAVMLAVAGGTLWAGGIALTLFNNPQGLQQQGANTWAETFTAGGPRLGEPGTSSFGLIQSSALESSNVDLSAELVQMVTAQRNFQANAKMISTADQISQAILNIR